MRIGVRLIGTVSIALLLSLIAGNAWGQIRYAVTDLGTLGGEGSGAAAINIGGQIVGNANTVSGDQHAFRYGGGVMNDLGTLGGPLSIASDINTSGQIVGESHTESGLQHAFVYSGGVMNDLGTLGGSDSHATGINDRGDVVGNATTALGAQHAFLYTGGVMNDMSDLVPSSSGWTWRTAVDINNSGQVAVHAEKSSPTWEIHACLYSDGVMNDLGTLGGAKSFARGINESGEVVGYSSLLPTSFDPYHAFLYSGGSMSDLGTLPGWWYSEANDINNLGQIVGWTGNTYPMYTMRAFLYSDGVMTDLNSLIPPDSGLTLWEAAGINDAGQIVGWGETTGGQLHAFLLNPVPEPSTLTLLGGCTIALIVYAFRRTRAEESKVPQWAAWRRLVADRNAGYRSG